MHDIIRIDHLSKRFGEVQAVQDLSFRVKEGELFAFLGVIHHHQHSVRPAGQGWRQRGN